MGFNTVGLFLNDYAGDVGNTADLGPKVRHILGSGCGGDPIYGVTLLPSSHADNDQLILAGGNRITRIAVFDRCGHDEEAVLAKLVDRLGYDLVKRPKRKGRPSPS